MKYLWLEHGEGKERKLCICGPKRRSMFSRSEAVPEDESSVFLRFLALEIEDMSQRSYLVHQKREIRENGKGVEEATNVKIASRWQRAFRHRLPTWLLLPRMFTIQVNIPVVPRRLLVWSLEVKETATKMISTKIVLQKLGVWWRRSNAGTRFNFAETHPNNPQLRKMYCGEIFRLFNRYRIARNDAITTRAALVGSYGFISYGS